MRTTLKRIDVGSAFRVGIVLYALIFAIFGLLFVAMQGLFLSALSRSGAFDTANDISTFFGAGILSLLCFYVIGVVCAAIFGGIQVALFAWLYNLTANWIGGIKIELETEATLTLDDLARDEAQRKRDDL
jgi:hypothetical protein